MNFKQSITLAYQKVSFFVVLLKKGRKVTLNVIFLIYCRDSFVQFYQMHGAQHHRVTGSFKLLIEKVSGIFVFFVCVWFV